MSVREAIELAVYSLVVEGAEQDLWHFGNRAFEKTVIARYHERTAKNETPTLAPPPAPKPDIGG